MSKGERKAVSAYLSKIGRLGGLVRNPTRTAALANNLVKARAALQKKRLATKGRL